MNSSFTLPLDRIGFYAAILLIALLISPVQGTAQIKAKVMSGMRERQERPKVGRTVMQALQADKKYSTFLSIVERAGMTSFLQGTVTDTTTPVVLLVEDSVGTSGVTSSNLIVLGPDGSPTELPPDVNTTLLKSDLVDAVREAMGEQMISVLAEEGRITVFAPINEAFAKLPKTTQDSLHTDSVAAATFVRAHFVNRGVYHDAFSKLRSITPLAGPALKVGAKSATVATINGRTVTAVDIAGDNGVAHGLDAVLDLRENAPLGNTPKQQ